MIAYTIYDQFSGMVIGHSFCSSLDDLKPGCVVGHIDSSKYYIDVSSRSCIEIPLKPSEHHDFDYTVKKWVVDADKAWALTRSKRNQLLASSDWRVTQASETGSPMDPAWASYRQALRDITSQIDPLNIVWPIAPA